MSLSDRYKRVRRPSTKPVQPVRKKSPTTLLIDSIMEISKTLMVGEEDVYDFEYRNRAIRMQNAIQARIKRTEGSYDKFDCWRDGKDVIIVRVKDNG